jgi:hypothetical protein
MLQPMLFNNHKVTLLRLKFQEEIGLAHSVTCKLAQQEYIKTRENLGRGLGDHVHLCVRVCVFERERERVQNL